MNRIRIAAFAVLVMTASYVFVTHPAVRGGGAPPYDADAGEPAPEDRFEWLRGWTRPDGPPRVGLQAGHWKNDELPDELSALRGSTGSSGGGKLEWEVNLDIATRTKTMLEARGITVDILPATVPVRYWADAFVAVHADGSTDTRIHGYKITEPRHDISGKAGRLSDLIGESYGAATGLTRDPNVSHNMRGYYAFSWWRRNHTVHPMAASVILETGFLTSPRDRRVIVGDPIRSARGIADGVIAYLESESLLSKLE